MAPTTSSLQLAALGLLNTSGPRPSAGVYPLAHTITSPCTPEILGLTPSAGFKNPAPITSSPYPLEIPGLSQAFFSRTLPRHVDCANLSAGRTLPRQVDQHTPPSPILPRQVRWSIAPVGLRILPRQVTHHATPQHTNPPSSFRFLPRGVSWPISTGLRILLPEVRQCITVLWLIGACMEPRLLLMLLVPRATEIPSACQAVVAPWGSSTCPYLLLSYTGCCLLAAWFFIHLLHRHAKASHPHLPLLSRVGTLYPHLIQPASWCVMAAFSKWDVLPHLMLLCICFASTTLPPLLARAESRLAKQCIQWQSRHSPPRLVPGTTTQTRWPSRTRTVPTPTVQHGLSQPTTSPSYPLLGPFEPSPAPCCCSPTCTSTGARVDYLATVLLDEEDEDEELMVMASTVTCIMPNGLTRTGLERLVTVECADVLAHSLKELRGYNGPYPPCTVVLSTDKPIFERRRNHSVLEKAIEDEKCGEMLEAALIEPSLSSTWASNLTFPAKRDAEGNWTDRRMCMDLRAINEVTVPDRYAMPNPDIALQEILGDQVFLVLDLRAGYHQIPIVESDRDKISFWWGTKLYRYTRMVMDMRNATAQFQRVIDYTLQAAGLTHCACGYVDDILVHSPSPEQHILDVRAVFKTLRDVSFMVHPEKCLFGSDMVPYLGHNVSSWGLTPQACKIEAIRNMPIPDSISALRSTLGYFLYYSGYNPNHAAQAAPLNNKLKKEHTAKLVWDEDAQVAYDALKANLCEPGRAIKAYDPALPLSLYTDWSCRGIGAVLAQVAEAEGSIEYMVACISRSLNVHERNYSSYQGEMLAVVWACKNLRHYLHGVHFTIVTDHAPLVWLMTARDLTCQHARWALMMQSYDFTIIHRAGAKHANADALSCLPLPSTKDGTGARMDEKDDPPGPAAALAVGLLLEEEDEDLSAHYSLALQSEALTLVLSSLRAAGHHDALDSIAPTPDELLSDCHGRCTALQDHPHDTHAHMVALEQEELRCLADGWVHAAATRAHLSSAAGASNGGGGITTGGIDTTVLGHEAMADLQAGVCVLELFGGIATVLEGLLRSGVRVVRYLYVDLDAEARHVMHRRLKELHELYPQLLPASALAHVCVLPQDITHITTQHLMEAGADKSSVRWFVAAGWPCQDFSLAGKRLGLRGPRASTYYALGQILLELQRIQTAKPPAYLLENAPLQLTFTDCPDILEDFRFICSPTGHAHTAGRCALWFVCLPASQLVDQLPQRSRAPHV